MRFVSKARWNRDRRGTEIRWGGEQADLAKDKCENVCPLYICAVKPNHLGGYEATGRGDGVMRVQPT